MGIDRQQRAPAYDDGYEIPMIQDNVSGVPISSAPYSLNINEQPRSSDYNHPIPNITIIQNESDSGCSDCMLGLLCCLMCNIFGVCGLCCARKKSSFCLGFSAPFVAVGILLILLLIGAAVFTIVMYILFATGTIPYY